MIDKFRVLNERESRERERERNFGNIGPLTYYENTIRKYYRKKDQWKMQFS